MLLIARGLAGLLGAFMLYFVLGGMLAYPQFTVPDLTLGALLLLAAISPERVAPASLTIAAAFALGVFSVALFNQLHLGRPVNPPLIATITVAAIVLLTGGSRVFVRNGP